MTFFSSSRFPENYRLMRCPGRAGADEDPRSALRLFFMKYRRTKWQCKNALIARDSRHRSLNVKSSLGDTPPLLHRHHRQNDLENFTISYSFSNNPYGGKQKYDAESKSNMGDAQKAFKFQKSIDNLRGERYVGLTEEQIMSKPSDELILKPQAEQGDATSQTKC